MTEASQQSQALACPAAVVTALDERVWLEGMAGSGKTRAGIMRLRRLLDQGVAADSILIFVPQRSLAQPYLRALRADTSYRGGTVAIHSIGSLSLQMVEAFWFLIAAEAGFAHPQDLPNFLSLELVQYFMTRAIEKLVDERDYFNSVSIDRARLYSQIIDNMNKAAAVGFPIDEIAGRLKGALASDVEQSHIYDDAQTCALAFRAYCQANNLLDFSLQLEVFHKHVWELPQARAHVTSRYKHLIADNVEEDNPASHSLLSDLLGSCDSALIIYDREAGFRRFLGADPDNARRLRQYCDLRFEMGESRVMSPSVSALGGMLRDQLRGNKGNGADPKARPALVTAAHRYHPQMARWVAEQIESLIQKEGVAPGDIAVLAPYLSDSLRFGLAEGLAARGINARSHRPSRALREEPAARALLIFARLAHPHWNLPAAEFDVAFALTTAIAELDLIRAKLLTEMLYRDGRLLPFADIQVAAAQDRITFELGARYDRLQGWLAAYMAGEPTEAIDIFFRRLFGEVLSRAGYGFHDSHDAGRICMNLVDSARGFRWSLDFMRRYEQQIDLSLDYARMVDRGVIAKFYLRDWAAQDEDSVLIAPAYTFLLNNRAVDYQFWLNIGSDGWSRRLYQPLTHPYVLSRAWQIGRVWREDDEERTNRETLERLLLALTRRCRRRIYLGFSELSESGIEQRSLLLETVQGVLRRLTRGESHV